MRVTLEKQFNNEQFELLIKFYQERLAGGVINWDLDMRQLEMINSMMLGMLVAFNASVSSRGGRLRMILKKASKVAELIIITKLDRIINVIVT